MSREPTRWGFGTPGPLRDKLTSLAFGGGKVVTSDLLANYEIEGEPVEQPGDISILLDSDERPVAMIEDVRSTVIRLADMTDEDAIDEGEGYAGAAEFRVSHEDHWNGFIDEVREGLGGPGVHHHRRHADRRGALPDRRRPRARTARRCSSRASARPTRPIGRPSMRSLADHDADVVARRGELVDARHRAALIVECGTGRCEGALTWILDAGSMEILTLHASRQWTGIGSALIAAARRVAEASGARRLWLITTNDNVDALRFYQRRGFSMARVNSGAVERSRATLKPRLPEIGAHGIPLRDEIELTMTVGRDDEAAASAADALLALELALAESRRAVDPRRVRGRPRPGLRGRSARAARSGRATRSSLRSIRSHRTRRSRWSRSTSPTSARRSSW